MSAVENGLASRLHSSHLSLVKTHSEYAVILDSVSSQSSFPDPCLAPILEAKQSLSHVLAQEIEDNQTFLELIKCAETLEALNSTLMSRVEALEHQKNELGEELDHVRRKLQNAEDDLIKAEEDKQELSFLLQLKTSDHDELLNRLSERDNGAGQLFDPEDFDAPFAKQPSVAGRGDATFIFPSDKLRSSQNTRRNEPADSQGETPPKEPKNQGNLTMCFNGLNQTMGAVDIDLEELSDKLSWYESVMRQLQKILGAHLEDPDAGYHQESTKILERAKRMAEYKEMITYYEGTITDLRDENSRLEKNQERLLKKAEEHVIVASSKHRPLALVAVNIPRPDKTTGLTNRLSDPSALGMKSLEPLEHRMQTKEKNVTVK